SSPDTDRLATFFVGSKCQPQKRKRRWHHHGCAHSKKGPCRDQDVHRRGISRDQRSRGTSNQTPKKDSAMANPAAKHTQGWKQTRHDKRKCVDDPEFLAA